MYSALSLILILKELAEVKREDQNLETIQEILMDVEKLSKSLALTITNVLYKQVAIISTTRKSFKFFKGL